MFTKGRNSLTLENTVDKLGSWNRRMVISAAGILASGWTENDKVFLLSSTGYSVSNVDNLEREIRNYDEENKVRHQISKDNLTISIKENENPIRIFGLWGGDGTHFTGDSWSLQKFNISLYEEVIGIANLGDRFSHKEEYWRNFEMIKLERLEYTRLKMGFSPNEKYFGIFGSAGAEIFERKK